MNGGATVDPPSLPGFRPDAHGALAAGSGRARYGQSVRKPAFARQNCKISSVMSMSQLLSDAHGGALPFLPGH